MTKRYFVLAVIGGGLLSLLGYLAVSADTGGKAGETKIIDLPRARTKAQMSVEDAIARRRSVRAFADKKLDKFQIGQLAWAAQGITEPYRGYRAAPSAGALYPLEIYLVTPEGIYHYTPRGHKMKLVTEHDLRSQLARAALNQQFIAKAALDIVIAAAYKRVTSKYGPRGIRYVHIEVGHAAENVLLQAVAMGLGAVPVGAFSDNSVREILRLPRDQKPLYIIPVGYPR